jgi:activator of HSP90 ATPase
MTRTIIQAAVLPAPPERLFDMYLDPAAHAAFTGAPVTIESQPGALFRAFDDMISGTILQVVPKRLIVQSWRAVHWTAEDIDSTLILTFWPDEEEGRIELVHVNVADDDFAGVSQGWQEYYWKPWRDYLEASSAKSK